MTQGLLSLQRLQLHLELIRSGTLSVSKPSVENREKFKEKCPSLIVSNADIGNLPSMMIALNIIQQIAEALEISLDAVTSKKKGQTLGNQFEEACRTFIEATFLPLAHLRPGVWAVRRLKERKGLGIGHFEQYAHLAELVALKEEHKALQTFLGDSYTIAPDVVVLREPEADSTINCHKILVDKSSAKQTPLRVVNQPLPILHASLSCKFTMRSDRAQNSRTEALNLLRSRKGRAPHIAVITAEPMPSRLASLALGTGDIDCVYHIALYELRQALQEMADLSSLDMLDMMIEGKRLKDISDLPLDLAV